MRVYETTERIRVEIKTELELLVERAGYETLPADKMERMLLLQQAEPERRVVFVLSPLTGKQKSEVMACVGMDAGMRLQDAYRMTRKAVKFALKGVEGLNGPNGEWKLKTDADGTVSEESLDVLDNIPRAVQILKSAALQMLSAVPENSIEDKDTGVIIPGVEVVVEAKK